MHTIPPLIQVYTDGDQPTSLALIRRGWEQEWNQTYSAYPRLTFLPAINLKQTENHSELPVGLRQLEGIRNPDIFFFEKNQSIELGGIEITDHSPDGSNIEKRYPLLWAAPRCNTNAFVITRYLKRRPGGQINRLPARHSNRNRHFLQHWDPARSSEFFLRQYLPLSDLHLGDSVHIPATISALMPSWTDLGGLFADILAARIPGDLQALAIRRLVQWKEKLISLSAACLENAERETEASTLIKLQDKWVQVYNSRPDSGHWERGEGQFDSIDGRVMFTLDEIAFLPPEGRPESFELWLPQMVSSHPWIQEQRERGFGSKRLRNLLVTLQDFVTTKFSDQLTEADWRTLKSNKRLLLERLDWDSTIYRIQDLVRGSDLSAVATAGINKVPATVRSDIESLLRDSELYYCAIRPYDDNPPRLLTTLAAHLPSNSRVLAPRLPRSFVNQATLPSGVVAVASEDCTKNELLMLRQLHRHVKGR